MLSPRDTWVDKEAYDEAARALAQMFVDNASEKYPDMGFAVREAGPHPEA